MVYIAPVYNGNVVPITLSDIYGEIDFWLLPFINPAYVRRFFPDEKIESYTDAVRVAIEKMNIDTGRRNVLLAHQFVTGSTVGGSEEISVGGLDNVDAYVFEDFDYVALGHIHRPQNIGSGKIRYCGTPLKYSVSEEKHHKSVTVVNIGADGELKLELRPLESKHDMRCIRGSFAEITNKSFYTGTATDDYLYIILTDEEDVPEAVGKLHVIYPNIMHLGYDNTRTRYTQVSEGALDVQNKSPLELFDELYEIQK